MGLIGNGSVFKWVDLLIGADIASLRSVTEPIHLSPPQYNALCTKKQQLDAYFFIRQYVKNKAYRTRLYHDDKNKDFSHGSPGFFLKIFVFIPFRFCPTSYFIATTNTN